MTGRWEKTHRDRKYWLLISEESSCCASRGSSGIGISVKSNSLSSTISTSRRAVFPSAEPERDGGGVCIYKSSPQLRLGLSFLVFFETKTERSAFTCLEFCQRFLQRFDFNKFSGISSFSGSVIGALPTRRGDPFYVKRKKHCKIIIINSRFCILFNTHHEVRIKVRES